ncbi:hypothetical protein ACOAIW_004845, partial [Escherichia coli]
MPDTKTAVLVARDF